MIDIKDKHKCCGCEACIQMCPKHCISLIRDKEGFLYPKVNTINCVNCGLCEKVCPEININRQVQPKQVWAAQNNDEKIRRDSSSGGIVTKLGEKIIEDGGVVFGVAMNNKFEAVHTYAETKDELIAFRGSKYIQSRIGNCFKQTKDYLKQGRKVLFIGTPCQISGLMHFLGKEYMNLYTVDFICHGVPSPGIFKWYLQDEIIKYAAKGSKKNTVSFSQSIHSIPERDIQLPERMKIMNIRFRDKKEGWKKYSFVLLIAEASADGKKNSVSISSNLCKNVFLTGFCSDMYLRPSCHSCPAREFRSGSDITVGDFWGQEYMFPEFDNDTGTSCVIIKTDKGQNLFASISDIKKEEKTIEQVLLYNPSLIYSKPETIYRRKFWSIVGRYSFQDTVRKAMTLTIFERIAEKIKRTIL